MELATPPLNVTIKVDRWKETALLGITKIFLNIALNQHSKSPNLCSFGVCCVFLINDQNGGDVNYNCSYIQNPDYSQATNTAGTYSYTVRKCDNGGFE